MKLEDIAEITVGQIMTRVTVKEMEKKDSADREVKILTPKAIFNGCVNHEYLGSAVLKKELSVEKYTKAGDVVIKLSTPYEAAYITEADEGLVIPSFCAAIRVKNRAYSPWYLCGILNTRHIQKHLAAKVSGAAVAMVKVSDLRNVQIPEVSEKDMKDIGEAYRLSNKKIACLKQLISLEEEVMQNIILNSMRKENENE